MNLSFRASVNGAAGRFGLDIGLALSLCRRLVLFGPSGSGKSLTLQAVAGLLRPESGRIEVGGRTLFDAGANIDVPARRRRLGFLFQDYALFPHLTLEQNLLFGLTRLWRRPSPEMRARVAGLLESFELTAQARHLPSELSGGQGPGPGPGPGPGRPAPGRALLDPGPAPAAQAAPGAHRHPGPAGHPAHPGDPRPGRGLGVRRGRGRVPQRPRGPGARSCRTGRGPGPPGPARGGLQRRIKKDGAALAPPFFAVS